jgi:hypothetical protein
MLGRRLRGPRKQLCSARNFHSSHWNQRLWVSEKHLAAVPLPGAGGDLRVLAAGCHLVRSTMPATTTPASAVCFSSPCR